MNRFDYKENTPAGTAPESRQFEGVVSFDEETVKAFDENFALFVDRLNDLGLDYYHSAQDAWEYLVYWRGTETIVFKFTDYHKDTAGEVGSGEIHLEGLLNVPEYYEGYEWNEER